MFYIETKVRVLSFLSFIVTYPLDITRTRLQVQGEHAAIKKGTIKAQAYRGMFRTALGIGKFC